MPGSSIRTINLKEILHIINALHSMRGLHFMSKCRMSVLLLFNSIEFIQRFKHSFFYPMNKIRQVTFCPRSSGDKRSIPFSFW